MRLLLPRIGRAVTPFSEADSRLSGSTLGGANPMSRWVAYSDKVDPPRSCVVRKGCSAEDHSPPARVQHRTRSSLSVPADLVWPLPRRGQGMADGQIPRRPPGRPGGLRPAHRWDLSSRQIDGLAESAQDEWARA